MRIYRCEFISNGIMLIIPGDRNFYELSDGILYISVGQIVPRPANVFLFSIAEVFFFVVQSIWN